MQIPTNLYKYVHPDRIDILENLHIRFTQPSRFNDPFEMCPAMSDLKVDVFEKAGQRVDQNLFLKYKLRGGPLNLEEFKRVQTPLTRQVVRKQLENPQQTKERLIEKNIEKWDKLIGILSLSATENNILMWAHYTDGHRGMLIEFDAGHDFFNPPPSIPKTDFGVPIEVDYPKSKMRPKLKENLDPTTEVQMLHTKSIDWEYEQEWRVFQQLEKCNLKQIKSNETVHLFKLPPKAIRRVVIGRRMDVASRLRIKKAISSNSEIRHIQVLKRFVNWMSSASSMFPYVMAFDPFSSQELNKFQTRLSSV